MAVESTVTKTTVTPQQHILQLATSHWLPAALHIITTLNIPDRLRFGPRTSTDLAEETSVKPDRLYRVMRAVATAGVLTEITPGTFALTPMGEVLRTGVEGTLRDYVEFVTDPTHFRIFSYLPEMVRTGDLGQFFAFGTRGWEFFEQHPDVAHVFNDAMVNLTNYFGPKLVEAYDFSGIGTLVDVGGGHGAFIAMVLHRYPEMKGIILEIPAVVDNARIYLKSVGLEDRCQVLAGTFTDSIPKADAIMMKHIVHGSDDPAADLLLRNCHQALADSSTGKLLLFENVVPEGDEPHLSKMLDLEMMAIPGGRERTANQYRNLLAQSGFEMTRIIPTETPISIIEAIRR